MFFVAGLLVLAIVVALAMQVDDWSRDFTTNRAATSANASDPLLQTLETTETHEEVRATIRRFVEQSPNWSANTDGINAREDMQDIHLIRTTRVFGFIDDIHITLHSIANGTRIDATSQSRIGKGDLGQNPRNLRELMLALRGMYEHSETTP